MTRAKNHQKRRFFTVIVGLTIGAHFGLISEAQASINTDFSGSVMDASLNLDVPNSNLASVTQNNGNLEFRSTGNVDMWATRNNAPFAWTASPTVGLGETWWVETRVTLPGTSVGRLAGITFYGGPDGSGGANQGMDFHFGIDNWGSNPVVRLQGLGDNRPGNLSYNPTGVGLSNYNPSVFLRTEITENGAWDSYTFMYKTDAASNWTTLSTMLSSVDNSRSAIFLKSYQAASADFDYFIVGSNNASAVPEPAVLALIGLGLGGLSFARRKRA